MVDTWTAGEIITTLLTAGIFAGGAWSAHISERRRRHRRAAALRKRSKAAWEAELDRVGRRIRASYERVRTADEFYKLTEQRQEPKAAITVMASPKSCVVRRLPPGRREAMIRELAENRQ